MLLQLAGSKRFTLVDHRPLHGLSTYPAAFLVSRLERRAPGVYASAPPPPPGTPLAKRDVAENFPLVNVSAPDPSRHPLYRHAKTATVEVSAHALPRHSAL